MNKPTKPTSEENIANTARDGQVAIKEEYDAAIELGTIAALELFIKRHPDSPWTQSAIKELESKKN